MTEYWLATAIGAGSGILLLALFAPLPGRYLGEYAFIALNVMLAIYVGARLVTGELTSVLVETAIASVWVVATRLAMQRWLPAIGIAIILHGLYDAFIGPHTGVASWYPPLCAGFDFLVGAGLIVVLHNRAKAEHPTD